MKKLILFLLPIFLALIVFFVLIFFLSTTSGGKGALQVTAIPQATVYLNGKLIGKTPLCKCDPQNMLPTGDYIVRLVPLDSSLGNTTFEQKVSINKSVLTVVDRTFGQGATSQGSVISLIPTSNKNTASLFVTSLPENASISLDDSATGVTPYHMDSLTESDHDLIINKNGYREKHIRIHAVKGYTLSVLAFLGVDPQAAIASSAAEPIASVSAIPQNQKILILDTPTGFLRVHKQASLTSAEITQVKPREEYVLQDEVTGWFEIKLTDGTLGWVSDQYAKKE